MEDDLNGDEMRLRSSQPPKAKRRRLRTLENKIFQTTLKKARAMKNKICIIEMNKSQSEKKVKIRQWHAHQNIEITNEIIRDCAQQQTAARKKPATKSYRFFCIFSEWVKMTNCSHRLTSVSFLSGVFLTKCVKAYLMRWRL